VTTTKRKLRRGGREPSAPLPDDLSTMTGDQVRKAYAERVERLRQIQREGAPATEAERNEALNEANLLAVEVRELRERGGDREPGGAAAILRTTFGHPPAPPPPRRRTRAEMAVGAIVSQWSLPNEMGRVALYPENLSEEQGEELYALLELRHLPDAPGLTDAQWSRFRELVEVAAGRAVFAEFEWRNELEALAEEVRLASLPPRVEFAEIGSVHLPASLLHELRAKRTNASGKTVGDVGALAAVLYSLDIEDASLLDRATIDHDPDGEPFLVCKGREPKFAPKVQPPANADNGTRTDLTRALDLYGADGWLDVRRTLGRTEIRRGPRAKALREGRPS
jgi:hypothetical protein